MTEMSVEKISSVKRVQYMMYLDRVRARARARVGLGLGLGLEDTMY